MRRWRMFRAVVCGFALGCAAAVAFFEGARIISAHHAEEIGMPAAGNAIKHALAAAETYAVLRSAGLTSLSAERAVIELGYLNERVEGLLKARKDPAREVYKDLFNNMSGIAVARWAESCGEQTSRSEIVKSLARANAIAHVMWDHRVPALPETASVGAAIGKFRADKRRITEMAETELARIATAGTCAIARGTRLASRAS